MTREQAFVVCFFGLLLVLLYQIGVIFRPFILPVLWAMILARLAFSLHRRLTARLGGREGLSAGLLTMGLLLLGVVPLLYLTFLLVQETAAAYEQINLWVQSGGIKRVPEYLAKLPIARGKLQEWLGRLIVVNGDFAGSFLQGSKVVSVFLLGQVTDLAKNAFAFTFSFVVMIFTLFFFLKDGPQLYQGLYELIPLRDTHKQKFFTRLDRTTMAIIQGLVLTALVQGLLAGAAYWILGVPSPLVLTALTALFSFIPFGGTALVWVPVTIYLFWIGPIWKGIVMLAWGAGIVSTIDHVIKPILIGHGAQLPTLFLFFSILGGLAAYGFIGLLLGPILLAILITAIQIYREEYPSAPAPDLVPESSEVIRPPES